MGAVGTEGEREGRRLLRNTTQFTQELRVGIHFLRKRAKPRNQETPIVAIALTLPTCVTSWAKSALVSTPAKWEKWLCFKYYDNAGHYQHHLLTTRYSAQGIGL